MLPSQQPGGAAIGTWRLVHAPCVFISWALLAALCGAEWLKIDVAVTLCWSQCARKNNGTSWCLITVKAASYCCEWNCMLSSSAAMWQLLFGCCLVERPLWKTACRTVKNLWSIGNGRKEAKVQRSSQEDEESRARKIVNAVKQQVYSWPWAGSPEK